MKIKIPRNESKLEHVILHKHKQTNIVVRVQVSLQPLTLCMMPAECTYCREWTNSGVYIRHNLRGKSHKICIIGCSALFVYTVWNVSALLGLCQERIIRFIMRSCCVYTLYVYLIFPTFSPRRIW